MLGYFIKLAWIPSYMDIKGNERVDSIARWATCHVHK